jgi:hypothetical protein
VGHQGGKVSTWWGIGPPENHLQAVASTVGCSTRAHGLGERAAGPVQQGDTARSEVTGPHQLQEPDKVVARRGQQTHHAAKAGACDGVRGTAVIPQHFAVPFCHRSHGQGQYAGIGADEQIHTLVAEQSLGCGGRLGRAARIVIDY